MKKIIMTILIFLKAVTMIHADTETVNGITWTYTMTGDAVSIGGGSSSSTAVPKSTSGAITIPFMLGGKPVSSIADYAFSGCCGLTSVTIPDVVTNIGAYAFSYCSVLTSVAIPNSVANIGEYAFAYCDGITAVAIPNSVKVVCIGAFAYCKKLKMAVVPQCICALPSSSKGFVSSYSSQSIKTSAGVSCFFGGDSIFESSYAGVSAYPCDPALTNIIVAHGTTYIADSAFADCNYLQSVTIPATVTRIGHEAFKDCTSLNSLVFEGDAPDVGTSILLGTPRRMEVKVQNGSIGWSGGGEVVLPNSWCGRAIAYVDGTDSGGTGQITVVQSAVTNFVYTTVTNEVHHYSTVTNYVNTTVTNEIHYYSTVTNEIFHYTTVTNVVKYVPEPGASPDAGYGINVGAGGETVIAGAAGWDAFGVPDGMEWNKETGTLSGRAKLSGAYDLILVSGSGADTKIMRTTLTVAPYDTIIGYVGVAFSQSGAPLDNLKSYKTLPAGLKWKKNDGHAGRVTLPEDDGGTLSGVPTKAQTLDLETVDGESVKIEIKALPDSVVGTFDGCVYLPPSDPTNGVANTCDIGGTITLTATAAGKISASVKTAKKTYSFSMASWAKFAEGDAFTLEASAELKTGEVLEVNATVRDGATMVLAKLSGGEFGGPRGTALPEDEEDGHAGRVTLPGCVTILMKDVYAKNGSKWIDEEAHGLMAKCKGTYQFGFDAVEESDDGGHAGRVTLPAWTLRPVAKVEASFLKVVLKDTGVATITGTLPDKTKVNLSAKATASAADGSDKIEIKIIAAAFSGKTITLPMEINLMNDGSFADGRTNCGIIYSVTR